MKPFEYRGRVEFHETDTAGIVHFSNYFRYMERAEHAWFRAMGRSIMEDHGSYQRSWPRLQAQCAFRGPLRFEDEYLVRLSVNKVGTKSLDLAFTLVRLETGDVVAEGQTVSVYANIQDGVMRGVPIPAELVQQLRQSTVEEDPS